MPTITGGGSFTGGVTVILPSATGRVPTPANVVNAWDLDYAQPESNTSLAWNVTTGMFLQTYNLGSDTGDTGIRGLVIGNNGTKLYATANGNDRIWEWDLSKAYDISSASYVQEFNTNAYETNNRGLTFKPDGSRMYTIGYQNDDVTEYELSDSWNVASASYVTEFGVATQEANPEAVEFKPDGTKMYITGTSGDDINEYDLSTAWDISTATYSQTSSSMSGTETAPRGMAFKPDGTSVWVVGINSDTVDRYNFSTPWDVSTMSYGNEDLYLTDALNPESIWFKSDGTNFYTITSGLAAQYVVGVKRFDVKNDESTPQDVFLKPDGTKMYIIGQNGDEINEYDLSVAFEVETASLLQTQSLSAYDGTPTGFYFKSDGTTFWMVGSTGDDVNEFSLSTPWDITSLTYEQNFSLAGQDTVPEGIHFKTDGTKMYMAGSTNDNIYEYDLSTAWDISTATYSQSISSQGNPTAVWFKPDGTKMFQLGRSTNQDALHEYALSSAWDISSATLSKSLSVPENTPSGVWFPSNGERMYLVGSANDMVIQYEFT